MATRVKNQVKTRQSLPQKTRTQMTDLLNTTLASVFDLQSQTKQAHWNVKGEDFFQLHKLFDELAEIVEDYVDTVAERITALGGLACGTVRMAASGSMLAEYPTEVLDSMKHVELLADRYAAFGTHARESIDTASDAGDQATADVYTEITRGIDKALYFLEAHLQA